MLFEDSDDDEDEDDVSDKGEDAPTVKQGKYRTMRSKYSQKRTLEKLAPGPVCWGEVPGGKM